MSKITLLQNDCQVIHYIYDFPTKTRFAYLEYQNHLVEAIDSRVPIEPLVVFYWQENLTNPNPDPMALRLDCERMPNNGIRMELKPELSPSFNYWDVESTSFSVHGKDTAKEGPITMAEIGFIAMRVLLKENYLARIRDDKLIIYDQSKTDQEPLPDKSETNGSKRKKGLKPTDPGYLTDWTSSRSRHPGEREIQYPENKDKEKADVATAPKKRAKVRRLNVPPHDVVKYGKTLDLWACWLLIYRQLYHRSRFGLLNEMPHYPRKTSREGRYYFCGNAYLARLCGLHKLTVRLVLKQLESENLIYTRYHGHKGRGCSIIEVPVNKRHVWKWCRQPGRQKLST